MGAFVVAFLMTHLSCSARFWSRRRDLADRMRSRRSGASYRSIDSTRSSGSQCGLPGPRRRWGFETRNETQFATRSPPENSEFGDFECFTSTDAFIVSNWVLFLNRARWRSGRWGCRTWFTPSFSSVGFVPLWPGDVRSWCPLLGRNAEVSWRPIRDCGPVSRLARPAL